MRRALRSVRFSIEFTTSLSWHILRELRTRRGLDSYADIRFLLDLLHLDEPDLHGDHPVRPPHRAQLPNAAKSGAPEPLEGCECSKHDALQRQGGRACQGKWGEEDNDL